MRITQEGDYALRVMLFLYTKGQGQRVEAKVISEHENIPPRFLLKLLRKLTVADIIKSYMGYGGGYAAEHSPSEITVKAVIEAVEGSIAINKCLIDPSMCNLDRTRTCVIHQELAKVQQQLLNGLDNISFKKLLEQNNK